MIPEDLKFDEDGLPTTEELEEIESASDAAWLEGLKEDIGLRNSDVTYNGSFTTYQDYSSIKGVKIA